MKPRVVLAAARCPEQRSHRDGDTSTARVAIRLASATSAWAREAQFPRFFGLFFSARRSQWPSLTPAIFRGNQRGQP